MMICRILGLVPLVLLLCTVPDTADNGKSDQGNSAQPAEEFFAARKVQLKFTEATPAEVIGELSKQSGYPMKMEKYLPLPVKPLITIDTGVTTFWQAFDQVLARANLTLGDIHLGDPTNLAQLLPPTQFAKYEDVTKRLLVNDRLLFKDIGSPAYNAAVALHPKLLVEAVKFAPKTNDPVVRKPSVLVLREGPEEKLPTAYDGPFRFRVVVCETGAQLNLQPTHADELMVVVEVTAEPRLQKVRPMNVKITKNEYPQVFKPMLDFSNIRDRRNFTLINNGGIQSHLYLRFRSGKNVKELRELAGSLKILTLARLTEHSLKNPLEAGGKSIDLSKGDKLEIKSVDKENDGYKVRYFTKYGKYWTLLDNKNQTYAKKYKGQDVILFLPQPGQGEPDRFIVLEPEEASTEASFRFETLPVKKLLDRKK